MTFLNEWIYLTFFFSQLYDWDLNFTQGQLIERRMVQNCLCSLAPYWSAGGEKIEEKKVQSTYSCSWQEFDWMCRQRPSRTSHWSFCTSTIFTPYNSNQLIKHLCAAARCFHILLTRYLPNCLSAIFAKNAANTWKTLCVLESTFSVDLDFEIVIHSKQMLSSSHHGPTNFCLAMSRGY